MKVLEASFNGGEVTPLLEGRYDLESLRRSCRKLRNYVPLASGAAIRRPSMLHASYADTSSLHPSASGHVRLVPFTFDTSTRYVLGFGAPYVDSGGSYEFDGKTRAAFYVWDDSGALVFTGDYLLNLGSGGVDSPAIIGTPNPDNYTFAQVNDIVVVASPNFAPIIITRTGLPSPAEPWTIESFSNCPSTAQSGWPNYVTKPGYYPPFMATLEPLDEPSDLAEGVTFPLTYAASSNTIIGGVGADKFGPFPATWRLYTGTTAFTGTIVVEGADSVSPASWKTIATITNASTGGMVLRQEFFCMFKYCRLRVTRSSGTATVELRHLGSKAAPTAYSATSGYIFFSPNKPEGIPSMLFGMKHYFAQLSYLRSDDTVTINAAAGANSAVSASLKVLTKWSFFTTGIWDGAVYLERQTTTGVWEIVKQWRSVKDQNFNTTGTETNATLRIRIELTDADVASNGASTFFPRFSLTSEDSSVREVISMIGDATGLPSPYSTHAASNGCQCETAGLLSPDWQLITSTATPHVAHGAFNEYQGYPAAVCVFEERLFFAGIARAPTQIFASAINDLFNFQETGLDDGGLSISIASSQGNPIQWMVPAQRGILIGTSGDEWLLDGADTGITPSNVTAKLQSRFGSKGIGAMPIDSAHLFVQRGGMSLREYTFEWGSQAYAAVDLSELTKPLTTSGIRCIAVSQNPESIIWVVMNDGSLLSVTYNRQQQVIAWAKHETAGTVESVCVTYGDTATADDVWLIVLRDGRRRLEKLESSLWASLYNGNPLYHLDAAVVKSGAAFTSITGCGHLVGLPCTIVSRVGTDAPTVTTVTPSTSTVSGLPSGTTHAVIGLAFTSELQPMPFEIPLQDGTAKARVTHTPQVAVQLYRSSAGKYADSATASRYDMPIPSPDFTGILRLTASASMRDSCEVYFRAEGPLPLNFVSVVPNTNVYGT